MKFINLDREDKCMTPRASRKSPSLDYEVSDQADRLELKHMSYRIRKPGFFKQRQPTVTFKTPESQEAFFERLIKRSRMQQRALNRKINNRRHCPLHRRTFYIPYKPDKVNEPEPIKLTDKPWIKSDRAKEIDEKCKEINARQAECKQDLPT